MADISVALSNMRVPIHEFSGKDLKNGTSEIFVTISTQGKEHLETIIEKLSKNPKHYFGGAFRKVGNV